MTDTFFTDHPEAMRYVLEHEGSNHMVRTPEGLEQITDAQRAQTIYDLAEKRYYEEPENGPNDATLLLAMATALLAKQMASRRKEEE